MGLFARSREPRIPKVPELIPIPPVSELPPAKLRSAARYLGTVDAEGERVIGQTLSARSSARLSLSTEALDVVRIAGSFRIPVAALRGATQADHFIGKPVRDLLVVRWVHQGQDWQTGFRMDSSRSLKAAAKDQKRAAKAGRKQVQAAPVPEVSDWVRTISKLSRGNTNRKQGHAEHN